jgi:hypothetical protein
MTREMCVDRCRCRQYKRPAQKCKSSIDMQKTFVPGIDFVPATERGRPRHQPLEVINEETVCPRHTTYGRLGCWRLNDHQRLARNGIFPDIRGVYQIGRQSEKPTRSQ